MKIQERARFVIINDIMYSEVKLGKTLFKVQSHFDQNNKDYGQAFEKITSNRLIKLENS